MASIYLWSLISYEVAELSEGFSILPGESWAHARIKEYAGTSHNFLNIICFCMRLGLPTLHPALLVEEPFCPITNKSTTGNLLHIL